MKKVLIPLFAIIALTFTVTAQEKRMMKDQHQPKHWHGMMAKQLNFSEDQKKQAKTINEDFRKKMQELNKNESITVKEMRGRRASLLKERKSKMEGLLTAEQKTKKAQLIAAQKAKAELRFTNHLAKMKTKLDLTDDQVAAMRSQRTNNRAKMEKIKNSESLSRVEKKQQMMALGSAAKEQHNKIFTAEQLKKMEEMKKTRPDKNRIK